MVPEPLSMYPPIGDVQWTDALGTQRVYWQIQPPRTDIIFPPAAIRAGIGIWLLTQGVPACLADPTPDEGRQIPITGRFINEGQLQVITLLESPGNKQAIVVAPKSRAGVRQTEADGQNLPKLERVLTQIQAPLSIPKIFELVNLPGEGQYDPPIPALLMEIIPRAWEVSCTYMIGQQPPEYFTMNEADLPLAVWQHKDKSMHVTPELLNQEAVAALARNQTLVYGAMGKRVQNAFSINAGDYMVEHVDGSLRWHLITMRGGLTEPIELDAFIARLFLHSEPGLNTQVGTQPDQVAPFAHRPAETLRGTAEGLGYFRPGVPPEEIRQEIIDTFPSVQALLAQQGVEESVMQEIVAAMDAFAHEPRK